MGGGSVSRDKGRGLTPICSDWTDIRRMVKELWIGYRKKRFEVRGSRFEVRHQGSRREIMEGETAMSLSAVRRMR